MLSNGVNHEASYASCRTSFLCGNKHPVAVIPARAWLSLFRPPNFLTVPGDVLAGFFLAGGATVGLWQPGLVLLVLAALLFYAAGLLLNDWADAEVDRVERPDRPIPSGAVARRAVLFAAMGLLAGGLLLCLWAGGLVFLLGVTLALAIGNYNLLTKNVALIAPVNMGFCRGLSFLLGAAWATNEEWPPLVWWGAVTLILYIGAVTHVARREMEGRYFMVERWMPAAVVAGAFLVYPALSGLIYAPSQIGVAVCFFLAFVGASRTALLLPDRRGLVPGEARDSAIPTPALIGRLIALLLPIQAAFVIGAGDGYVPLMTGALLLALWPVKKSLGRLFYSS